MIFLIHKMAQYQEQKPHLFKNHDKLFRIIYCLFILKMGAKYQYLTPI
jgi:hypothetical protein